MDGAGNAGGMDGGMGHMNPPASPAGLSGGGMEHDAMMHMNFFWGDHALILFSRWPGDRGLGIYLLALFLTAAVAAAAEYLSALSHRIATPPAAAAAGGGRKALSAVALTAIHAIQMGMLYLVMLAVMSFNGGVLIAAVIGHAVGFFIVQLHAAFGQAGPGGPPGKV